MLRLNAVYGWVLLVLVGVAAVVVATVARPEVRRRSLGTGFPGEVITIPLTAAPFSTNYDMYINLLYWNTAGQAQSLSLLCDSGNNTLIMPYFEQLDPAKYVVRGTTYEPWGCPCNIVEGQILIPTQNNEYWYGDMVFLACTGPPDPAFVTAPRPRTPQVTLGTGSGIRTYNFGLGTGSFGTDVLVKAPLAYLPYEYTEILMNAAGPSSIVQTVASLARPAGYSQDFPARSGTILNLVSASQSPDQGFRIDTQATAYADCGGQAPSDNSVLFDTGGGISYLTDPNGCLATKLATQPTVDCGSLGAACPGTTCYSMNGLEVQVSGDGTAANGSYTVQYPLGHTLAVVPTSCRYAVWGATQPGMNVGGSTFAEAVDMLITYKTNALAFRPKTTGQRAQGLFP